MVNFVLNKEVLSVSTPVEITLGADPELEQSEIENAYKICLTTVRSIQRDEEIGVDGSGCQIEIHPKATKYPWYITANIGRIIRKCPPVSVKGDVYPLGCHIHFGIPRELREKNAIHVLVNALDHFLGFLVDISGSARGSYKERKAYRIKNYGFEYRTIPSSILIDKEITYIVFKAAKNIVEYMINNGSIETEDNPSKEDYLKYCGLTEQEYNALISFPDYWNFVKNVYPTINSIWRKYSISFMDEWNEKNKRLLKYYLIKYGVTKANIYGLRQSRGKVVAGFYLDKYETIEHPSSMYLSMNNSFGLPFELRNYEITDELAEAIAQAIKRSYIEGCDVRYLQSEEYARIYKNRYEEECEEEEYEEYEEEEECEEEEEECEEEEETYI